MGFGRGFVDFRLSRFLMLLLAEMLGGALAWHVAKALWFHSLQYSQAHMEMFVNSQNMCTITHKVGCLIELPGVTKKIHDWRRFPEGLHVRSRFRSHWLLHDAVSAAAAAVKRRPIPRSGIHCQSVFIR